MKADQHITMFTRHEGEIVRCVIGGNFKKQMQDMGWVTSVDDLPEEKAAEVDQELKSKAKDLKIKGYTKMTNKELKQAIEGAEQCE